jgi:uncharacterized protein (DUF983 family)
VSTPTSTILRRGFTRRCAVCGEGHLFRQWLRMVPSCPRCGLRFNRLPGHWLGSWFLNVVLVQVVVVAILIVGMASTYPETPMAAIGLIDLAAAVAVPLLFFPFSRTIWLAIDVVMRPLALEEDVPPGYLLEDDIRRLRDEREPSEGGEGAGGREGRDAA